MECGNDALPAIGHQNRDAIGGLHGEQQAGHIANLAVGAARALPTRVGACRPGCIGAGGLVRVSARNFDDKVRMELAEGEDRGCGVAGDGFGQQAAVGEDGCAVVGRGEAKIQLAGCVFSAIGTAQAAGTCTEPAPKPGKIPAGNGQPFDSVGGAADSVHEKAEIGRASCRERV